MSVVRVLGFSVERTEKFLTITDENDVELEHLFTPKSSDWEVLTWISGFKAGRLVGANIVADAIANVASHTIVEIELRKK